MKRIKLKVNHLVRDGGDYLVQYLTSLGINKFAVSSFLNHPVEGDQDDPLMLDNIQYAVKMAYEALTKENAHVFVQIDSDTDGYTSSAVLINYLKRRFPAVQISYALHPGKEHGIIPKTIIKEVKSNLAITSKAKAGDDIKIKDIPAEIEKLKALMKVASAQLDFERAIEIRDTISQLKKKMMQAKK